MSILNPFQLLELNVISAQDLAPVSRSMRTYAVAWVHPDRKLSTRVDTQSHNNPTWNDKFVFRVDDEFLHADTSAVMIEIYALHWFKDIHVGTVRILVGNLVSTPSRLHQFSQPQPQVGMRFVALQVRRTSGRPQGILNIGVALLHSSMRSMPLYSQLSTSAIGYRNLMGEEDRYHNHHSNGNNKSNGTPTVETRSRLQRSKSDMSSMMGSELRGSEMMGKTTKSKASSMVNGSDISKKNNTKEGRSKPSSMIISGSIVIKRKEKPRDQLGLGFEKGYDNKKSSHAVDVTKIDKSSTTSGSEVHPIQTLTTNKKEKLEHKNNTDHTPNLMYDQMSYATPLRTPQRRAGGATARATPMHEKLGTPRKAMPIHNKSPYTKYNESDLGPSPSEVAAQMASQKVDDNESSIIGGLSLNDSVEGLQSKLGRWKTQLPPVYDDHGQLSSSPSSKPQHKRRHSDGAGLFSCFSNICGCECSIVCGGSPKPLNKTTTGRSPEDLK